MHFYTPAGPHIDQQHVVIMPHPPQVRAGAGQAIAIGVGDIVARAVISGPEPRADFPAIVAEGGAPVAAAIDVAMRPAVIAPILPQFLPRLAHVAAFLAHVAPVAVALGVAQVALFLARSEEHTSELQSLMRISYAVFCLKKKTKTNPTIFNTS